MRGAGLDIYPQRARQARLRLGARRRRRILRDAFRLLSRHAAARLQRLFWRQQRSMADERPRRVHL